MIVHHAPEDRLLDDATEYCLGLMSPGDASAFESHCEACQVCGAIARRTAFILARVGMAIELEPDPGLKTRVFVRIAGERNGAETRPAAGWNVVLAGLGEWIPSPVPGVAARILHVDAATRRATMLVRMEPGVTYPPHRHGGVEELFVLSGDLSIGPQVLRAGDYHRAASRSVHPRQTTAEGCLIFTVASLDDEFIEPPPRLP